MHLKKIEMHGFKSFANKVKLEFMPGINAIVGPNGSGKSNIIDAIRWVLGEQRVKTIRGSKLEDVIFAGSISKKPMGMAEVSLTLDNTDGFLPLEYSEICITRKAFRSGESEFYINKTPCRLKDIQELLMDTGIGKDGYSIISQGQVDRILTCRPEERRLIFEEVAGIMKHKTRKQEAEKHLEETMANIERIDDILLEIQNQLGPLAVQKQKALQYQELSSVYKKIHINLLIEDYISKQNYLNKINKEISTNEALLNEILDEKSLALKNSKSLTEDLEKIQMKYEEAQKDFFHVKSKINELQRDLEWSKEESFRLEEEQDKLLKNLERLNRQTDIAKEKGILYKQKLEQKRKEREQIEKNIQAKLKELDIYNKEILEKQNLIEESKSNIIEILNSASEKRNIISSLNTMKQNLKDRLKQISREQNKLNATNDATKTEIDRLNSQYKKLNFLVEDKSAIILDLEQEITQMTDKLDLKTKKLAKNQKDLSEKISRYKALKEINDNFEDYNYGVRNLLNSIRKNKVDLTGIYGALADIILVEKKYEVAIETALGAALQNIVCKNENDAKLAINFLKERRLGRATFLPLTSIKPRKLNKLESNLLSMKGCLSTAESRVSCDTKFRPIIKNLLGRVIIADNIENAIRIAQKCNFSIKIVTLDGDLIYPGGAITGGSRKSSSQILTRKRELIECKATIKVLERDFTKVRDSYNILKDDIERKKILLSKLRNEKNDIISNVRIIERQIHEKNMILDERNDNINLLDKERHQIKLQIAEIESDLLLEEANISKLDTRNLTSQDEVKKLQEEINNIQIKRDNLTDSITDLKVKLASFKQEEIGIKQQLKNVNQDTDSWSKELKSLEKELSENEHKRHEIKSKVETAKKQIETNSYKIKDLKLKISELEDKRAKLKKQMVQAQEKTTILEDQQKSFEVVLNKHKVKKAQLNIKLEQIKDNLWETYSLTTEEAYKIKRPLDCDNPKSALRQLRKQMTSLGHVNINAIKDHEKLSKRFDFLKDQREDLIKAKLDLDVLINEITKTMEEMLTLSIKKIQKEFNKTFNDLFGGGKAKLVVEGDSNILNSGIEIIAQPPGKKLQSLSLLSGGERALTAIALLFAILNSKKTPFCVLDEIEAALDDANIYRFSSYLKRVSKHTQFIIITHRRGTMEAANALYGISMEESAVSKILSVKLN